MHAFLPDSALTIARLFALLAVEFITGFGLQYVKPSRGIQFRAWVLVVAATLIAHWITLTSSPGFRMLGLIAALFLGMKAVVGVNVRAEDGTVLPLARWFAFTAGWPGMRPGIFTGHPKPRKGFLKLSVQGFLCAVAGASLMLVAGPVWRQTHSSFIVTIFFFIGSSLLVHYGFFTLMAAFWRSRGFDCGPLFQNPLPSENLGDFWGRRWNLPFHEMTAVAVYRPLAN
jgi:alginate O-acetyltransferase complex protein AlgI